jgi:two-component system, NtrC family, response regulator AtoC
MDLHFQTKGFAQVEAKRREFPGMPKESRARRVLVVDDEALIRWSLTQTLEDRGFEVQQASSASDALERAGTDESFNVVLLDFRLPDSNDLRLLARMRQLLPGAAVILMTAYSTPEMAQGALDLGAISVVSKPFEMKEIAKLVTQVS